MLTGSQDLGRTAVVIGHRETGVGYYWRFGTGKRAGLDSALRCVGGLEEH